MSDAVCIACEHGPHRKAPCTTCGCRNWQNADVVAARALVNLNNVAMDILHYCFPDLEEKVIAGKLKDRMPKEVSVYEGKEDEQTTQTPD